MPKKFKGENSKAVDARIRKAAVAEAARAQKEKEKEDAYWEDDNKSLQKKQQRKAEKEMKRTEILNKKKEKEELYNTEMESLKSKKVTESKKPEKITRAQIAARAEQAKAEKDKPKTVKNNESDDIEQNINRVVSDFVAEGEIVEARNVEDAISALAVKEEFERHPERRMKAAYTKFEEENMPRLKKENPNLRLSQLKQMLKKDWQKCPDNPMNQRFISYNAKT